MAKQIMKIEADNGKEFDTLEEAQKYEEFTAAKERYKIACQQWNRVLANQFTTGDGKPFGFERSNYYYVREHVNGSRVSTETLYSYQCVVSEDGSVTRSQYNANGPSVVEFQIDQLFTSEKAALVKLLEIREKEYQWATDDLLELRKQIQRAL